MIGRTEPVRPFDLIRWARRQAHEHDLKPLEAHVLLILATYADENAEAFPSIGTLARDAGLKVKVVKKRDPDTGRTTTSRQSSAVSAALARLQEFGLIWRKQAGRRPATVELLFKPSTEPEGEGGSSPPDSRRADGSDDPPPPSGHTEPALRPRGAEGPGTARGTEQQQQQNLNGQKTPSGLPEGDQARGSKRRRRSGDLRRFGSAASRADTDIARLEEMKQCFAEEDGAVDYDAAIENAEECAA